MQMVVPASLLHAFCAHEDTVHCMNGNGVWISEEHHHCIAPDLTLPPLFTSIDSWEFSLRETANLDFHFLAENIPFHLSGYDNIRGPPKVVASL
jgi:hypothetical protein